MEEILTNLEKRGFKPYFAKDKAEAVSIVKSLIPENSTVGFGGSMTVGELNLVEELKDTRTHYNK